MLSIARQCARQHHSGRKTLQQSLGCAIRRQISTLPNNSRIFVHEVNEASQKQYVLSYLEKTPPLPAFNLGATKQLPVRPDSFKQNENFLKIVHWVIKENAVHDPAVQAQAAMFASEAGSSLGSGGALFTQNQDRRHKKTKSQSGGGAGSDGGASSQGGMGGAGRGGYIHVSDQRNPPDFGRVAWPEDIFGSLEIDGQGKFVEPNGRYQEAGTYRLCTNDGILQLSPFLADKVKEKIAELDEQARRNQ